MKTSYIIYGLIGALLIYIVYSSYKKKQVAKTATPQTVKPIADLTNPATQKPVDNQNPAGSVNVFDEVTV